MGSECVRPGGMREMARIAGPLILGMASYTIMQFCDRVFLSRFSSVAIQAALPAGLLAHTFSSFFQTLASYAGTFTAHYHGARRPREGAQATVQGIWLSLLSWPVTLALIPLGFWIMGTSGHPSEVVAAEKEYFYILMLGGVMVPLNAALGGYFMGIGKTSVNFVSNLVGCLLNVLLNYVMIFGHWGCPALGIAGAAYATILSGFACFFIQLALFLRRKEIREAIHQTRNRIWALEWPMMRRIIRYGAPSGLELLMELGSYSVFILLVGRMGELALAASNIALSINNLAFAPLLGFGMAASTLVSQHQGGRRPVAAERAGYSGLKLGMIYMVCIGLTFLLFPREYFELFHPKDAIFSFEELYRTGRVMMVLMAVWGLLDVISIVIGFALKGAGDTRFVLIYLTALEWLVWLPVSILLIWLGFDILSLWICMAAFIGVLSTGYLWRWRRGKWKSIRLIDHKWDGESA